MKEGGMSLLLRGLHLLRDALLRFDSDLCSSDFGGQEVCVGALIYAHVLMESEQPGALCCWCRVSPSCFSLCSLKIQNLKINLIRTVCVDRCNVCICPGFCYYYC